MKDHLSMINWYPGHMAKTKRLLQDQIKRIDLVIEICDARLPYSSRNPDLDSMISNKRRLLFLNKSDLSDPNRNQEWIAYFRSQNTEACLTDAARLRGKETIGLIERATKEIVDKALQKGVRKTVRAMIVGIPNVGKSTLINRHDLFSKAIDKSVETLLAEQREKCRQKFIIEKEHSDKIRNDAIQAFNETICRWLDGYGERHYEIEILCSGQIAAD